MGWLVALGVFVVGAVVWVLAGPQWVLAPLAGYSVYLIGTSMLRNMARDARATAPVQPEPVDPRDERTVYSCDGCGAELLLVVRGAATAPRHCGEAMRERIEVPRV